MKNVSEAVQMVTRHKRNIW